MQRNIWQSHGAICTSWFGATLVHSRGYLDCGRTKGMYVRPWALVYCVFCSKICRMVDRIRWGGILTARTITYAKLRNYLLGLRFLLISKDTWPYSDDSLVFVFVFTHPHVYSNTSAFPSFCFHLNPHYQRTPQCQRIRNQKKVRTASVHPNHYIYFEATFVRKNPKEIRKKMEDCVDGKKNENDYIPRLEKERDSIVQRCLSDWCRLISTLTCRCPQLLSTLGSADVDPNRVAIPCNVQ